MGRDRTRIERLEQLSQTGGPVTDVTGTSPIVVTTPTPGVRNVSISGVGAGTVTSVNVTGSDNSIAVTGSPITSSGTINLAVAVDPLTAKTTPVAADEFILADSAASFANKKITYANLGSGFLLAANNLSDVVSAIASIDHISKISTTIAAAATTDLTTATGDSVTITGGATISSLGNGAAGIRRVTAFGGVCTLVHNVSAMDLITAANITTVIGDKCEWVAVGSNQWQMVWYTRYDGTALVGGSSVTAGTGLVDTSNVISLAHSVYVYFG